MRDLNYQLKQLCRHCREGSYATQAKRERMLTLMANQLHELGYRGMSARSLKPKHIEGTAQEMARAGAHDRHDQEPNGYDPLVGEQGG